MESVGLRRAIGSRYVSIPLRDPIPDVMGIGRHIDVFVNQEAGSETKLPHSPVSPDSPYSADSAVVTFNSASGYPIEVSEYLNRSDQVPPSQHHSCSL